MHRFSIHKTNNFAALLIRRTCIFCAVLALSAFAFMVPTSAYADTLDNTLNEQLVPDSSFLYDATIEDLATADTFDDKLKVRVIGEAIGEAIKCEADPNFCWVTFASTVEGSSATISAYMPKSLAAKITHFGQYNTKGTKMQLTGTFNLVCSDHAGMSDLHVLQANIYSEGENYTEEFKFENFIPAFAVFAAALVLSLIFLFIRERGR